MATVERGMRVQVRTADGLELPRRAVSGVEIEGHDFPIVWVTTEEEWDGAAGNGHQPEARPWPAEDVQPA